MGAYRNILRGALLVAALLTSMGANAQPLDSGQQDRLARQEEQMRQAGWQVMYLVDFGQMGEIWDQASQVMKDLVKREDFVRQLVTERVRLGAVVRRTRPDITRSASDGRHDTPAGLYINVISTTRFAHHPEPVQELVSFRLDEDQTWRVTGYSVQ